MTQQPPTSDTGKPDVGFKISRGIGSIVGYSLLAVLAVPVIGLVCVALLWVIQLLIEIAPHH